VRLEHAVVDRELLVLGRKAAATTLDAARTRLALTRTAERLARERADAQRARLESLAVALGAHDPERTLARGYALVEGPGDEVITTAEAARAAGAVRIRFADDAVQARIT
jgi:exodeoxyribonuclease VII large subunit